MNAKTLQNKYLQFFKEKNHTIIPSASLIPIGDASVLFNTAGMQPLAPYLLGTKHPAGTRLVNVQKCLRTVDFTNIGDNTHHTFFQMLGNWSLGDYFKKEAINWSFEFLTSKKWLNLPLDKLAFTVYQGDKTIPRDEESAKIWKSLGIKEERLAYLGKDNFWSAGDTGPCGPSTEIFYWTGDKPAPKKYDPDDERWVEIWNNVFMAYNKTKKVLLIDGMHTLYDKEFNLNQELLTTISEFTAPKVLVVNGFREKGHALLKKHYFDSFSLENESIKKDNPEFFKRLLDKFNLAADQVLYIDHKQESTDAATSLGIQSELYSSPQQAHAFIHNNLYHYKPLPQKNVDTGMGFARTIAVLNGEKSAYETDLFTNSIKKIESLSNKPYKDNQVAMRIIADHLRSAVFVLGDENAVKPSNVDRGYILRRLIRRAIRYAKLLGIEQPVTTTIAKIIIQDYKDHYQELVANQQRILTELQSEEEKFSLTLEKGLKEFNKMAANADIITGKNAFLLFQSFGFPVEMTQELANEQNIEVDIAIFNEEFEKHQELSRTSSQGKFKGGLADHSDETIQLHTATHLLNEALRKVIDPSISQRGSNITPERLRFDFAFDRKLTKEEIKKVEDEVNRIIKEALDVTREEMAVEEAQALGAQMEFGAKYGEKVSVYFIGDYSKEFCGGPHVENTSEIGIFRIVKEKSSAAGIRRIKAVVE